MTWWLDDLSTECMTVEYQRTFLQSTRQWFKTSRKTTSPIKGRSETGYTGMRNMNQTGWGAVAIDQSSWRHADKSGIQISEKRGEDRWEERLKI